MSADDSGDVVLKSDYSIWPLQSTLKGGMKLKVCVPSSPLDGSLHLHFSADIIPSAIDTTDTIPNATDTTDTISSIGEEVVLEGDETQPNLYRALAPPRSVPGEVQVSLCCADSLGHHTILHTAQFTYTLLDTLQIQQRILEHTSRGLLLQSDIIPLPENSEERLELDRVLTAAVQRLEVTPEWRTLLDREESGSRTRAPQSTLLHLASRLNLLSLARHLVTISQVDLALCLPDEQGLTPVDIAKNEGNIEMLKILTSALLQTSVTGGDLSSYEPPLLNRRNGRAELLRFREINEEWRGQIRRHKISSSSMGSTNFNPEVTTVNHKDRLPTPPFPQNTPSTNPHPYRRKSIAVMEQRHPMASNCLQINVKDPMLALSERQRKQSWSVVVGGTDCRSVDTGLNELDRVIATDRVQQYITAMEGELDASQEIQEGQETGVSRLDPTHLNLLYCYSVSCPQLAQDDESGTSSILTSTRTSPGPDIGYDPPDSPPLHLQPPTLAASISVPDDLSETGVHMHMKQAATGHPPAYTSSSSPHSSHSVMVPQVITTQYSAEDLSQLHMHDEMGLSNERGSGRRGRENVVEKKGSVHLSANEEEEEEEEEDEEGDDNLCQSVSAPHLRADSDDGIEGDSTQRVEGVKRDDPTHTKQNEEENKKSKVVKRKKREVAFGNGHAILDTKTSSDGSSSDQPRLDSTHKKKSHRRSQSLSVVELGVPPKIPPEEGGGKILRRNRGSSTIKTNQLPVVESNQSLDQQSSESASRSNSIKDNRSRASSLLTDGSSMHESGESTSEDDTMPELSGLSCASQEGGDTQDEPSTTTPIVNESEQQHLKPPSDSPDGGTVMLRGKKGRVRPSPELRYSADVLSSYQEELKSNSVMGISATRRLNSESIDERKAELKSQRYGDSSVDSEKGRLATDSVFDQAVTLSDVDVRVQSDDNLSQEKSSPLLSAKEGKKKAHRSPRLGRRAHTVKETTPPTPKKLVRGLTKDDVSPLIGKMRSILNSHDDKTVASPSTVAQAHNSSDPPPSNEAESATITTSPGGGSTNLDRLPRSPLTSINSNCSTPTTTAPSPSTKYHTSPLSFKASAETPPPFSPSSPAPLIKNQHTHTTPTTLTIDLSTSSGEKGTIHKSSSEKLVTSLEPHTGKKTKSKSISLDGSASSVREIMDVKNMLVEPLQEENTEEDDELAEHDHKLKLSGKKEGSKAKIIRDNFFRRSKSHKKALTILGGGPEVERAIKESYSKGSGGTGAVRAKSAKHRPKLDDVFTTSSQSSVQQPTDQQTNEDGREETKGKRSPRKLSSEHRRDSDSSLVHSPTSATFDHSLSVVSELPQSTKHSSPADPNSLSPAPIENTSDSDREEVSHQLVRSMSESHPELEIKEDKNWERTMDRRLLRKMNKHERDRQNIIHELIQTERHHFRALHVLKLVFKEQMEKYLSEESLTIMFPELDNLIDISRSFLDRLEERRGKEGANVIIHDISDILLEEFTAGKRERILQTFGEFCTYHLIASEMYKEQLKKKQFGRLVQQLYRVKECQRLYLPDYYTSVSQRLTKMVQFLARLVKKTDVLKLDHSERLRQCQRELETLVAAVDQHVDDRKNKLELEEIQDKLDISLPRTTAKNPVLQVMKDLKLTAQSRRLLKRGDAQLIHGHGKQLPVHIVLVTDLVVLLTERDQKYNLPAILDLKPPIIRLYDLHVRVNASVRSGVQLLLLEKGSAPEMFRLDFKNKKEAKEWEVTLTNAGDVCKEKGIKCEYFGSEPIVLEVEKEEEMERRPSVSRVRRSESQRSTSGATTASTPPQRLSVRRLNSARSTLDAASKVLSMFVTSSSVTIDVNTSPRHPRAAGPTGGSYRFNNSPKNRHNTIHHHLKAGDSGNSSVVDRESLLAGADIDGGGGKKPQKSKIKRKGLDRSSTFKGRGEDKKEKEKEKDRGGGGGSEAVDSMAQQHLMACAMRMKESLEDLLKECEEKDMEIARLKRELEEARESAATVAAKSTVVMPRNKISPHNSPPLFRPHSCHVDITNVSGSLSQPLSGGGDDDIPCQPADTGT